MIMAEPEIIHSESAEGIPNYLQYFQIPNTNVTIEKTYMQQFNPLETFNATESNLKFRINGLPDTFIDLKSIRLSLQLRVLKEDGTKITETTTVFPGANIFHSLFQQVSCFLKDSTMITRKHIL
jgi:hypothetical protein